MTGPPDPNHDDQECVPVVLPIFGVDVLSFTGFKGDPCVKVALPFGWGPVVDPDLGVLIGHLVRDRNTKLMPRAVLGMAKRGELGFKVVG